MSCPTGHPAGQCKELQSDKQGQRLLERESTSHVRLKGGVQGGEGTSSFNSSGRCRLLCPRLHPVFPETISQGLLWEVDANAFTRAASGAPDHTSRRLQAEHPRDWISSPRDYLGKCRQEEPFTAPKRRLS